MKSRVDGTDTMNSIHKHEVPRDRFKDDTYGKITVIAENERQNQIEYD